jgi:hypothetical protein
MKAIQIISQDLFDKVRSRFTNLEMGDENGAVTIDPADARFFDFDFVQEGNDLGRVSISLNNLGTLKVYYSQGITENQDDPVKQIWYNFLKEMRFFAMRRLLRFDTRDIAKTNLDKNDFQHLAATQGPKEEPDMNTMNESKWNNKSSKKTSRAVRGKTEVIVRHAHAVDEEYAGSRSQKKNIKAIFIQNSDGERFKYPFIHPAGAFAMAQHVDHGGIPHDPAGKAIIKMSEDIAQLQEFQRKIQRASLHDDATGITERAVGRLQELKSRINALGGRQHYESWVNEFNEQEHMDDGIMELDAVTLEDYKSKFTQTSFQEELSSFFPLLHRIMSETNTVDLDEYVNEGDECSACHCDPCECDDEEKEVKESAFAQFEDWADATEAGTLTPDQMEEFKNALAELPQGPAGPELELGAEGETAWQFFQGLGIDDPKLENMLRSASPDANPFDVLSLWNPTIAQSVLAAPAPEQAAPAPAPEQPTAENDDMTMPKGAMETKDPRAMIKMIAEKVKSFYNRDNPEVGPFRGGEGIAIDVEKECTDQFGPEAGQQARQMAEAFMQKLTTEWEERHGKSGEVGAVDSGDGLSIDRLKELLGNVKSKVEGIADEGAIGRGVGGIAGGAAGEMGGAALGGLLGGPVGAAIGGVAGNIAGTSMGADAGDELTGKKKDADESIARLKELLDNVKSKVEGIGDRGISTQDFNKNIMSAEDQVNELSKDTLKSYSNAAGHEVYADQRDAETARDRAYHADQHGEKSKSLNWADEADWLGKRAEKRAGGIAKATTKIAQKEDTTLETIMKLAGLKK